ncbi:acyl-CoA/acyl-ACP dehydrogenase [Roseomonas aerophila]|uniref:Acyl-CoA/acyl-ACP dehydrogenase n=1 Tax=Teichococcus aerophilus TaxID=1224513 RepID=A0ABR7RI59_9PROT|nr:acyl-CoA dehydrogenase family protein [Pseudoroseomonas aerophila]MBC9206256.1 acyl-CoA/acyl-ACP dehydrogenase [Pseudoroseomonas aerophila]
MASLSASVASLPRPLRSAALLGRLRAIAPEIEARAAELDSQAGALPAEDIARLGDEGLLMAPLPTSFGGCGWGVEPGTARPLFQALRLVGRASLPLGRLFEGHVNALRLAFHHGTATQQASAAAAARAGQLFGVWNAEDPQHGLWLEPDASGGGILHEGKILCSGAGLVGQALVTARSGADGPSLMLILPLEGQQQRADLSRWTPSGMRASATGSFDFEGMQVARDEIHGGADAYFTQPGFSGGAWRFLAVQLGGMEALAEALRQHFLRTGRGADPHQAARFGQVATAVETARLWVQRAAVMAEDTESPPEQLLPYVDLARGAVESAALEVLEHTQRSVGLQAFMRPAPVERIARDLMTYLRQPGPDRALASGAAAWLHAPLPMGDAWDETLP